MKKFLFFLSLISAVSFSASAQDTASWTLEECISYAHENNISLKRQALATELSKADLTQSKLNALPDVNGQVEHDFGSGRVLDRGTYQWLISDVSQGDLGIGSNVTLFSGLQGLNRIKMSKANYLMSLADLELLENNVTLLVMTGYLDLLRKKELMEVASEQVRITELQVERMEKLMEVGNASEGDVLEVKAQHSTEKYNYTVAKNEYNYSKLSLIHVLNLPVAETFSIVEPKIVDPGLISLEALDVIYENAIRNLPQIRSAEHNITYQEKNLAVARGALSPELYLRALYYSNYSDKLINPRELDPFNPLLDYPIPLQVNDNQYKQLTLGLSIPIFNKWQAQTNISKAKIGLEDARYKLDDARQKLLEEVQQYYSDALGAMDNHRAASETFVNSEEAYRYTEERFRVGMATALELEEARNRLFTARTQMITTKYVFVFYSKILDFYQGNDIHLEQ